MKKWLLILLVLALVIAGVAYWLSRNLDGLVKTAIESYGSSLTQAKVSLQAVNLSSADGQGSLHRLTIGNPNGFKTPHALRVERVDVEVDIATLAQEVVIVRRINIVAPDVIYERGETQTNFDAIAQHITRALSSGSKDGKAQPGKKLIVKQLTVRDAQARASAVFMQGKTVAIALPDITLKDLGAARGGISPGELGAEITNALRAKLTVAAGLERLTQSAEALGQSATAAVKGLFK